MAKGERKSVSGTGALPEFQQRQKADDVRGRVEKAVMRAWAEMNVREPAANFGRVPVDHLVPIVRRAEGTEILDPTALLAVNTTIQWLFGTNVGRARAQELLKIEAEVFEKEQRRPKVPISEL